jgi:hypothetical protein
MVRIARNSRNPQEVVETQIVAHAPSNVVIRAGGVAAHAHSADNDSIRSYSASPPPNTFTPPILLPTMGSLPVP